MWCSQQVLESNQEPGTSPRWSQWIGNRGKDSIQGRWCGQLIFFLISSLIIESSHFFLPLSYFFTPHVYSDSPKLIVGPHNLSIPKSLVNCSQNNSSVDYRLLSSLPHSFQRFLWKQHSSAGLRSLLRIRVTVWLGPKYWSSETSISSPEKRKNSNHTYFIGFLWRLSKIRVVQKQ